MEGQTNIDCNCDHIDCICDPKKGAQIEVYYGYYLGDAQVWDTIIINVPADSDPNDTDNYCEQEALKILNAKGIIVAFTGILGWIDEGDLYKV